MDYKAKEKVYEKILLFSAFISVITVVLIGGFIFIEGLPLIKKVGVIDFLLGQEWYPTKDIFGILPMIVGTFAVTFGALILGVPLGVATAIFLAEFAPPRVSKFVRPAVELLAGIPSVVYGLFGMVIVNELLMHIERTYLANILKPEYQRGYSVLSAAIILAIMILPTVINISEDAIRSVPNEYKEASLALGATDWQTIYKVTIPAASSGIIAAIVLGMGRALGETMAVIMVAGNTVAVPDSIFAPVRTLTGNIAIEMGYAAGDHVKALFATGIVLFVIIMLLNTVASFLAQKGVSQS
ncbi:phosphate ABC transporter permease subunit PstC [Phosphitispora fastidiosa]|uniref:phosphate ABC transporter permease subunit PstC n=1 Tax=Phosphitispora fastidiosa TaxID=2837202 RepID=UPI001E3C231E|nr:phosphate ABC transporter permease subunit PstC [Phosphitispora fastidiosa]MBU7005498.1 phosphate transport system permease protein [Phosphitispora fastidiosa]